jgi:hypothetical protein
MSALLFPTKEHQQFVLVSQCNFGSRSLDSIDHHMMLQACSSALSLLSSLDSFAQRAFNLP